MGSAFQYVFLVLALGCLFSCSAQYTDFHISHWIEDDFHLFKTCQFDQIYQFGDSISDSGNLIRELPIGAATAFAKLPYGKTLFRKATGRCSDGLLIIDYIAMATGLRLVPAYKNLETDYTHGVNFAVAGATALSSEALANKSIISPVTHSSLNVQLDWMYDHFNSMFLDSRERVEKLQSALFMVGEIGWNDYNYAIFQGKPMEELRAMVPDVVAAIMDAARKVIDLGAARVVIPGIFPIGCLPMYKTAYASDNSTAYDEYQCVAELNDLASYHNNQLENAIYNLTLEKPNAIILYGDYFYFYQYLLQWARFSGMPETERACCGIGGKYNFNLSRMCGAPDVPVCEDPHRYVSWDGIHLTQQAYKVMAGLLMRDIFPKLQCHL